MKRIIALGMVCVIAVFYVACGSSKASDSYQEGAYASSPESAESYAMADTTNADAGTGGALTEQLQAQDGRKIIYDSTLYMEALDFDATTQALNAAVQAAGGYVSNATLENETYEGATRYASYVYRIPANQYDAFLKALGAAGNITSQQENTQDVTADYVDLEARIKSLRLQEERLLSMMEQAGELETLLAIQEQLTEVQYRIESYTSQQRTYDNLIDYSTVTVNVEEVKRITEVKDTFGRRISAAFGDSWHNFGIGCQNFAVGFVYFLPTLLILLVLGGAVYVLVRAMQKQDQKRRAMQQAAAQRAAEASQAEIYPTQPASAPKP